MSALADVQAALKAAGLAENIVPIPFTVTAVTDRRQDHADRFRHGRSGSSAALGRFGSRRRILAAAGIDAGRIENIVVTHFHPDHISGLMAKDTNARAVPESHNPRAGARTCMVDRSVRAAGRARLGQPHQGHAGHLEERQSIRGRQGSRAGHPRDRHARPHAGPHELSRGLGQPAADHPGRHHQHPARCS